MNYDARVGFFEEPLLDVQHRCALVKDEYFWRHLNLLPNDLFSSPVVC